MVNVPLRSQLERLAGRDNRLLLALEEVFSLLSDNDPAVSNALLAAVASLRGQARSAAGTAEDALGRSTIRGRRNMPQDQPFRLPRKTGPVDYVDFNSAPPGDVMRRRLQWNTDDGTLDFGLREGVVLQIGQETHYYAKNTSGATIPDGAAIMATGTVGASAKLEIGLAVADGSVPSQYMLGIATNAIAANDFGYVAAFGLVRGIDTSAWADFDLLYFDPATPGGLTNVQPTSPALKSAQAIVIHSGHGGSGSIFVTAHRETLVQDLTDVEAPVPADGDVLRWSAANSRWENAPAVTGATGSFTAGSGETVAVSNGIITSIT